MTGRTVSFNTIESSNNQPVSDYKSTSSGFSISPYGGIFVRKNLFAGLLLGYGQTRGDLTAGTIMQSNESESYSGGLLLRRYFPIGGSFYFHVAGSLAYGHSESTGYSGNDLVNKGTSNNVTAGLSPGVSFAFGKRIILETGLPNLFSANYYSVTFQNMPSSSKSFQKGINANFGAGGSVPLSIGFNLPLGK
ncbi:MAG: hypothetical protein EOO12_00685 [Chitinophagaceae bacterium]|nr:MAG: hypothetical protein EOO12_00685 [Chitinophagaceae bacterium]